MAITLLNQKRIVLGVTGSIAAYKAVDLASKLTQAGALVDVVMTDAAQRFVTPLAFRSVTGRPVYHDLWGLDDHVLHIDLGENADLVVIAPATAHTVAKLAYGLADNLLSVTALATRGALLVAPAMDGGMFAHPATQANLATLLERGVKIVGPATGRMASGLSGQGRLVEPEALLGQIRLALALSGPLAGQRVVVTAGPTQEPLDPVRFISNRSSGKQGFAVAQAALDAGATVTLVAGPVSVPLPVGVDHVPVRTAAEMHAAVVAAVAQADALCMVAAVADYRPQEVSEHKIKKTDNPEWGAAIGLERTLDILTAVKDQRAHTGYPRVTVGFAAETQNAFEYGRAKLLRKGLDIIAVNDVTAAGAGFGGDTNRIILISAAGEDEALGLLTKSGVAEALVERIAHLLNPNDI